jgi:multidrug efflux system membrane fusion protein
MSSGRRSRLRITIIVSAVIAMAVLFHHSFQQSSQSAQKTSPSPIPVVTATAKLGDQPVYLTGLGSVVAFNTVALRSRVDGELENVAIREGQMVRSGDLIAQIDPRPFEVQLSQAEGQKERDEAFLANAKVDLERYKILYAQDSIAKQQLDTQLATVQQYEATVKADQAAIDNAKLQLSYARITSPITGRIGLRQVDPGNIVHASDQNGLAVITQLQPISVIFTIPQDNIAPVMKQLAVGRRLRVDAYDRELENKISTGSLLTIDNQVDVTTGTVRFKAVFDNNDNALFPNQFVNARLLVDMKRRVVLVPAAAIQRGPEGTFVFVVNQENTVETRNVAVGTIEGDIASIDRGLSPNEVVVIEGVDKLEQGTTVTRTVGAVDDRP